MDGADSSPTPTSPAAVVGAAAAMHHASRPTLGFPLGTALLLIVIFCLSGIFSCCYHWDKLRSLRRRRSSSSTTDQLPTTATAAAAAAARQRQPDHTSVPLYYPSKLTFQQQNLKQESEQSLLVIMPGDRYPKFMARPCPPACVPSGATTVIAVEIVLVSSHFSSSPSPSPPHTL